MANGKGKRIIKKALIAVVSLAMIVGFIVLFISASKDRNKAVCRAVEVQVENQGEILYIDKAAIKSYIIRNKALNPIGKQLSELNIKEITDAIGKFPWVKNTEVYVDNDNVLRINMTERVPIARVFADDGSSYYLDGGGTLLPANPGDAISVPVFTGFTGLQKNNTTDSLLISQMVAMTQYISSKPFWNAQIAQININSNNQFELIPTVGNALIEFGSGEHIENKLNKLLTFYRKGLNNVGWGYYDTIDLRYEGQVIATRRNPKGSPVIDSILNEDGYKNTDSTNAQLKRFSD